MIRINGYDFNGSVSYPVEKLVAAIATEDNFDTIFTKVSTATEVIIVNNNEVVASYAAIFNGIEKVIGGYKIVFNRAPMTVHDVETLMQTVAHQGEQISAQATTISEQETTLGEHGSTLESNATELDDILVAITELGDLIAELIGEETSAGGNE